MSEWSNCSLVKKRELGIPSCTGHNYMLVRCISWPDPRYCFNHVQKLSLLYTLIGNPSKYSVEISSCEIHLSPPCSSVFRLATSNNERCCSLGLKRESKWLSLLKCFPLFPVHLLCGYHESNKMVGFNVFKYEARCDLDQTRHRLNHESLENNRKSQIGIYQLQSTFNVANSQDKVWKAVLGKRKYIANKRKLVKFARFE